MRLGQPSLTEIARVSQRETMHVRGGLVFEAQPAQKPAVTGGMANPGCLA